MITSEKVDQLFPALLEARRSMSPVFKGKKNDHFKYAFANEEAWHDAVQPSLLANSLILTFSVDRVNRSTPSLALVEASARVTHAVSGQYLQISGCGEGEDRSDKAAYKAMTGAKKYLYALLFALPTTDDAEDPENDRRRQREEAAEKIKTEKPKASVAEVNGALAAQGIDPVQDPEEAQKRAKAKALYEEAKVFDKIEATRISKGFGRDWDRICEELIIFIRGAKMAQGAK